MIAVGFVLAVLSWTLVHLWTVNDPLSWHLDRGWSYVISLAFWVGCILLVVGVASWLWANT